MRCDFCYERQPAVSFEYPARDFEMLDGVTMSRGSWLACEECAGLIEQGDFIAVAVRNIERSPEIPQGDIELVADLISLLVTAYGRFRDHRTGPRIPLQVAA